MKIAFISDIHGILEALGAVLDDARIKKADRIYCAGDIVGYGYAARECCDVLRVLNITTVAGNHDKHLCSYFSGDSYALDGFEKGARRTLKWTSSQMSLEQINFLSGLPVRYEEEVHGKRLLMAHGDPKDPPNGYLDFSAIQIEGSIVNTFLKNYDILVVAGSHSPRIFHPKGMGVLIDPGSVAFSRSRTYEATSTYALVDTETLEARIIAVRLDENKFELCVSKLMANPELREAGIPERFIGNSSLRGYVPRIKRSR